MKPLHMFQSGCPEWVIAYDKDDAHAVYEAHVGSVPDDSPEDTWEQLPDEATSTFWLDAAGDLAEIEGDGARPVEMTNAAAIAKFGHGFYATSEA
jgi:hypothetical protein